VAAKDFTEAKYAVLVTRAGKIKKTELKAFSNPRATGIIAIDINEGDDLHAVELSDGDSQIFIGTHDGMAIRFDESDVRAMGRGAAGVKGIELREGDYVVEADVFKPGVANEILTITEHGFGKRTPVDEYRLQSRGGLGVINIRTTDKNGKVVGITTVTEDDQLLLITKNGKMIRVPVATIRSVGRSTQGVKLINLEDEDAVVSAVKVVEKDLGEGAEGDVVDLAPPEPTEPDETVH